MIGAGQAGLSSAYYLRRYGFEPESGFVVLDHAAGAGGAWQYRWPSLSLAGTHRVHDLPGMPMGDRDESRPAAQVVPEYFAAYEGGFALPVHRPVNVRGVRYGPEDRLLVDTTAGQWAARAVINATGTWERPFWPSYPGQRDFAGRQLHTADYESADEFAGQHVVVIGGGTSAVQLLAEISRVTTTTWVTRRPPDFFEGPFTEELGRSVVERVAERVRAGRLPQSIVSETGLPISPLVREAMDRGALRRLPMFERIVADGVVWADGTKVRADVLLWCTGFRPVLDHLAPLGLRTREGGIAVEGTRAVAEPRLHLVGYGPSASTIGANRAGRTAVREIRDLVEEQAAAA